MTGAPGALQSASALVRRPAAWVARWHGGQLATLWLACTIGPWRIGVWRHAMLTERLRVFADPGSAPDPLLRTAALLVMWGLPLLALLATAAWVRGRAAGRATRT